MTLLYRPQRGGLDDSIQEVQTFDGTRRGLQALLPYPLVEVHHYGWDPRIQWETYIVMVQFPDQPHVAQPIGFTNGPVA